MNAAQARIIAQSVRKPRSLAWDVVNDIKEAAEAGNFCVDIPRALSDPEHAALTAAGYHIHSHKFLNNSTETNIAW